MFIILHATTCQIYWLDWMLLNVDIAYIRSGFGLLTKISIFFRPQKLFLIDYIMNRHRRLSGRSLRRHRHTHTLQHNQWPLTVKFLLSFSRPVIAEHYYYSFRNAETKTKRTLCLQLFTWNVRVPMPSVCIHFKIFNLSSSKTQCSLIIFIIHYFFFLLLWLLSDSNSEFV